MQPALVPSNKNLTSVMFSMTHLKGEVPRSSLARLIRGPITITLLGPIGNSRLVRQNRFLLSR